MSTKKTEKKWTRINHHIRVPQVRVKGADGEHLGVLSIQQALELSQQAGLDLVEIVPTSNPPICHIMDWGKFKFEEKKKKRDQLSKSKAIPTKEARLRPVSSEHDVEIKINQVKKWISDKHPVYVNIKFKNREMQHKEQGHKIMQKILQALEGCVKVESPPRFEGDRLSVRLVPKPS